MSHTSRSTTTAASATATATATGRRSDSIDGVGGNLHPFRRPQITRQPSAPSSLFLAQLQVILWKDFTIRSRNIVPVLSIVLSPAFAPAILMFFLTRANLFLTAGGLSAAEGWVTASAKAAAMAGSGRAWSRLIGTALGVVTRGNGLTIPPEVFFVRILLPFYVILGFGNHQQISLIETVSEKEKRTKEGLLMQGLSINVYWMSKIVLYGTYAAVSSFLFAYVVAPCYPTSNFVIIALIIGLFDAANIASSLALSAVFRSAKSAAVFGSLLPFIFLVLTGVAFGYELLPSETAVVLVSILLYPVGVFYGLLKVHQGELRGNGTSWGNLWTGDGVGIYLVVLALSVALYTGLAIYLDQIIPQGFGTTKAWDFPLHRFRRRANRHPSIPKPPSAHPARDPAKFQPDPVGKTPLVVLENVDRVFGDEKAVDGVSLNVFEDEVFAVLGHNGAGKSTLIHMLTGLLSVSGGCGSVAGFDMETEMDSIRRVIGVCPQFDLHYEDLTAGEHVLLFSGLRGLWRTAPSRAALREMTDAALEELGILKQRDVRSKKLSGGEKRKLSVAMAIVGSPKVVILDEPTSGMDPVSRRNLWDVLRGDNKGRVTLFTTHQMDEADVLADRKAFMTKGRIQCLGTSAFLKSAFNIGYHLSMLSATASSKSVSAIQSTIHRYLPVSGAAVSPSPDIPGASDITTSVPAREAGIIFPKLLAELDGLKEKGLLTFWGVEAPKLEEVFLKTVEPAALGDLDNVEEGREETDPLLGNADFGLVTAASTLARLQLLIQNRLALIRRTPLSTVFNLLACVYFVILTLDGVDQSLRSDDVLSASTAAAVLPVCLFATPLLYARESIVEKDLRVLSLLRVVLGARNARRDESRGRAGLPPAAVFAVSYWGAGWFVQVMLLLSVVAFTVWWAWFRSIEAFIGSGLWMFVAVQVAAAAAWPMLAYLVSLPFKSADFFSVTASLLSTFYLFPFLFVIFLSSSMSGSFLLWHLVFSFTIPFYGLPAVFYFMVMAYANNEGTTLPVSYYFEWTNHMLPALLGIISHFLIGAIALVVYEFSGGSIWRPRRAAPPAGANEDSDVKQERRRLEPVVRGGVLDTFGITMKDLHKSFVVLATDPAKVSSDDSSAAPADEEAHHHPPTPPAPLETSGPFDLWKNRVALQSLTLGVPRGELFTLLGPNGAGKTTALSMALAELQPDAGDVWLNAPRGVGYAPQQEAVWPLLSVREHLTFYAGLKGLGHLQSKKWAEKAARELGLVEALDKRVKDTSGGMKRKLGFALAIVGAVDVLFLDEPSTGIDPAARLVMRNFLQARQQQFSTLLTTHSMDEADTLSTRIGILVNGALACIGSPGHLKRRFGNSYVLELVFAASDDSAASTPAAPASAWLARAFPGARSLELFDGVVARWEVPVADVAAAGGLARCFAMLEAWRAAAGRSSAHPPASAALWRGPPIVDYSLGMTSLEMIFMRFARGQVQSEVP